MRPKSGENSYAFVLNTLHKLPFFADMKVKGFFMNLRNPGVFPVLLCLGLGFMAVPLHGSMVSVLVIETGLDQEAVVRDYSTLWEDGIMGVFFEAGHIVTNGSVIRLGAGQVKEFPEEAQADFNEASEGGADYFILALLEYKNQDGTFKPSGVSLRLYRTVPRGLIYEERFPAGQAADNREEHARAREAARVLISHIKDR
jgi:hypothetical protein